MSSLDKQEYERRFLAAVAETKAAGIWFSNAVPPYVRILRKFGRRPVPPHYAPMHQTLVSQFLYFSIAWGLLMSLLALTGPVPIISIIIVAIFIGILFALIMTAYLSISRKINKLTKWDEL